MDYLFHYYPNDASYEVDMIDSVVIESSSRPHGLPTHVRVPKRSIEQTNHRNVRKCIRKQSTGSFKRVTK